VGVGETFTFVFSFRSEVIGKCRCDELVEMYVGTLDLVGVAACISSKLGNVSVVKHV
jgi:hypothetical protein